jgi:hypothetical protein
MHGLHGMPGYEAHWEQRQSEVAALLEPLEALVPAEQLRLAMVNLLLSSAPLHSPQERVALITAAKHLACWPR